MTIPPGRVSDLRETTNLNELLEVSWVSQDPQIRCKLREVIARYHELTDFLSTVSKGDGYESDFTPISPKTKRIRSDSSDSIVAEKPKRAPKAITSTVLEPMTSSQQEWECKKCTFLNSLDSGSSCAICGWFKPRSEDSVVPKTVSKREYAVEAFLKALSPLVTPSKAEDAYVAILSRNPGGGREHQYTGVPMSSSPTSDCEIYRSPFNLLACGQAQEEPTWINALEKDIFAQHNLDEELLFTKRFTAASKLCSPLTSPTDEDINSPIETIERELLNDYASACNSILGVSQPSVKSCPVTHTLTWTDWELSGVHSKEFLSRLAVIHSELVRETHKHYQSVKEVILSVSSFLNLIQDEVIGRRIIELILSEPRCDLNLHCLSHVEGDNLMDRFLLPASMERANMIYSALINVWTSEGKTAFIAARPPGHHCPSFEDRLIGLSASSNATNASDDKLSGSISGTKLERQICRANGLSEAPREHGMGFCALNGLAVALRRFLQLNNPAFEKANGRSIRVAILDLDIHAGNGTELVFRDSRSVLHISFHRYGWLSSAESGSERVMPGTHYYKDVGGVFGKHAKRPRGEGYSVNITLRKGDGNAEVLSGLEAIALPIMKEFSPDLVLVACGFDGLKLSPVFKRRWGEASCPGMDAEYTPSLFGYTINRVRANVQTKVVAATEGGYDPISVGLAARSVVKGLRGTGISKPPLRTFNADWMSHLNNIFQHQQPFWSSLD